MARTRISTTVDSALLEEVRRRGGQSTDAQLVDAALAALLDRYRRTEFDRAYAAAYDEHPIDEPDEWGDLSSFRDAAAAT